MRILLSAVALTFVAAPALAGGAEEFFLGRPPSVGVVQGGAFGLGGSDYLDERPGGRSVAGRPSRIARRVVPSGHVRRGEMPPVARPYYRP